MFEFYDGKTCFECGSTDSLERCKDCDFMFCDECLTNRKCADCRVPFLLRSREEQLGIAIMLGNNSAGRKFTELLTTNGKV
jgi:hypothetical protein